MQRDLPAPSPTRFERVAAKTVLTSVSPKKVVRLLGCQKVQVNASVGNDQEVLPEYQALINLEGKMICRRGVLRFEDGQGSGFPGP